MEEQRTKAGRQVRASAAHPETAKGRRAPKQTRLHTPEEQKLQGAVPDAVEPGVVTIPSNPRKQKRPEPGRGGKEGRREGTTFEECLYRGQSRLGSLQIMTTESNAPSGRAQTESK